MASTGRAMNCLLKGSVFKSCTSLIKAPAATQIVINRQFHDSIEFSTRLGMQDMENETFYHSISESNREALRPSEIISTLFNANVETDVFPQPLGGDSLRDNMSVEALIRKSIEKRAAHVQ